ncbi:hypothetical protein CQ010_06565 [Arthrobacter sp. MYb211]|nr:hypothetical protein CQ015_07260 [Arthrobacter sp. MYb221]PRC08771.1 hypothetical protein CQ010_06565 [Arthrobacter sp. MYb211]
MENDGLELIMMFQATLDSVAFQLDDAQSTTRFAIEQLSSIGSLTWRSSAGKAFASEVSQLSDRLVGLTKALGEAESYLSLAIGEMNALEAEILNQRMAS